MPKRTQPWTAPSQVEPSGEFGGNTTSPSLRSLNWQNDMLSPCSTSYFPDLLHPCEGPRQDTRIRTYAKHQVVDPGVARQVGALREGHRGLLGTCWGGEGCV